MSLHKNLYNLNHRIRHFSSFLLTYEIVENAAECEQIFKKLHEALTENTNIEKPNSSWNLAATIASYTPKIAFVQISDAQGNHFVISA